MSRIEDKFKGLRAKNEKAFIGYITAGLPKPEYTLDLCFALVKGGADMIELGIPFSDPMADGRTIQESCYMALEKGVRPMSVLKIVKKVKQELDVPLVLLSYYNPIFRMGLEGFLGMAKDSGVDGLIIPDLPVDEAEEYIRFARRYGIDTIFLASPNTPENRLKRIVDNTRGFLYLVSLYGVTGAREKLESLTMALVSKFSSLINGKVNLAVGFGISRPEHVRTIISNGADGVIVGSGIMKIVNRSGDLKDVLKKVEAYVRDLKDATKICKEDIGINSSKGHVGPLG